MMARVVRSNVMVVGLVRSSVIGPVRSAVRFVLFMAMTGGFVVVRHTIGDGAAGRLSQRASNPKISERPHGASRAARDVKKLMSARGREKLSAADSRGQDCTAAAILKPVPPNREIP